MDHPCHPLSLSFVCHSGFFAVCDFGFCLRPAQASLRCHVVLKSGKSLSEEAQAIQDTGGSMMNERDIWGRAGCKVTTQPTREEDERFRAWWRGRRRRHERGRREEGEDGEEQDDKAMIKKRHLIMQLAKPQAKECQGNKD